jgi:methylaspartate mutase sigma subunit
MTGPIGAAAAQNPPALQRSGSSLSVVLSSVASDSHTWNLVYLQLALEEHGHQVVNLGACVPDEMLIDECLRVRPDLVVISSVNGHGFIDGSRLIARVRAAPELADTPVVIGGMLGITGPDGQRSKARLLAAGYTAVFDDGARMPAFRSFLTQLTSGVAV